jgi:hypothetical protein
MQEAVIGFMISSLHEFFTDNAVGHWPTEVADGHFTLRISDMRDAVWVKLAHLLNHNDLVEDPRFSTTTASADPISIPPRDFATCRPRRKNEGVLSQ